MNPEVRNRVVRMFADMLLDQLEPINGLVFMSGGGTVTVEELCRIGRDAIELIERRVVH